jgi:hypothetical protein
VEERKALRVLKEIDDLNSLSLKELEEEYLKDSDSVETFIKDQSEVFDRRRLYSLYMFDKYEKLEKLLSDANYKYPESFVYTDTEREYLNIKNRMNIDKWKSRTDHNQFTEDKLEAEWMFKRMLGLNNSDASNYSHEKVIKRIYRSALLYEKQRALNYDFTNEYIDKATSAIKNPERLRDTLIDFAKEHKMYGTMDKEYLYFVNYMLLYHPSEVDERLINNARCTMKLSNVLSKIGDDEYYTKEYKREYKKLSTFTEHNIKEHQRIKNKSIVNAKRLKR